MLKLIVLISLVASCAAIPINNGVQGDPEIECGPTSIQVTFNTQNNFEGHVYVKGLFDKQADGCRTDGDGTRAVGSIELPFEKCDVKRERSANPKGIFVRTTIVISFHPNFLTKVDRAYTLQCFYMEADKTVSTNIEVSEITTAFQTQVVPMPVCRYEILDSQGPNAQPVRFAIIGQGVFHKWTCDTETVDTFCMHVYGCFVVDPTGADRLDLIDDTGCALDRYLMGNIEYPTDLMGVKEVHVFKYADRPALFFQCQISIVIKEPNAQCPRPQCSEPSGRGDGTGGGAAAAGGAARPGTAPVAAATAGGAAATAGGAQPAPTFSAARPIARSGSAGRGKRDALRDTASTEVDVTARLETLDLDNDAQVGASDLAHRAPSVRQLYAPMHVTRDTDGICMSPTAFAVAMGIAIALVATIVTVIAMISRRDK